MFYFHTLSQSACETGVEFMAKGRKFLFSHFTDRRDQAVHECLQSPLDPTAKNTDRIQPPAIQSLTISAPQVSFTFSRCFERVQKLYLIPHFFSQADGTSLPLAGRFPGPLLTEIFLLLLLFLNSWRQNTLC